MAWPDDNALSDMGFSHYAQNDRKKIALILRNALVERVNQRIYSHMDDRVLGELDPFMSGNVPGMERWLDEHVPGYDKRTDFIVNVASLEGDDYVRALSRYGALEWRRYYRPTASYDLWVELKELAEEMRCVTALLN